MKTKILIVDDEPDVRDMLQRRLVREGFMTEVAADGRKGLEIAREYMPDLVLLDISMPGGDGFGMLQQLQAEEATRRITVVMVTARTEMGAIQRGQELGATDYIMKPIDFTDLLKFIRKYTCSDDYESYKEGGA
jgi:DNA-binding response OmpR family regulator